MSVSARNQRQTITPVDLGVLQQHGGELVADLGGGPAGAVDDAEPEKHPAGPSSLPGRPGRAPGYPSRPVPPHEVGHLRQRPRVLRGLRRGRGRSVERRWRHRSRGCGPFADLHRRLQHLCSAGEPVLQIQIHDELVCASLCGRVDIVHDLVESADER
jgi:hypothetical protein